jgi:hypothetical protein
LPFSTASAPSLGQIASAAYHLGSTSIVVSAGTIEEESDYSPFGTETIITGSGVNKFKFTSKERDSESGLDDMGARSWGMVLDSRQTGASNRL